MTLQLSKYRISALRGSMSIDPTDFFNPPLSMRNKHDVLAEPQFKSNKRKPYYQIHIEPCIGCPFNPACTARVANPYYRSPQRLRRRPSNSPDKR